MQSTGRWFEVDVHDGRVSVKLWRVVFFAGRNDDVGAYLLIRFQQAMENTMGFHGGSPVARRA